MPDSVRETGDVFEFGRFRLDAAEQQLHYDGHPVSLTPKAFSTLFELVRKPGKVLTKRDLLDSVWPDTIVEEATLTQNIYTLRKVMERLDGAADSIETVPRRGYRFTADVRRLDPQPDRPVAGRGPGRLLAPGSSVAVLPFRTLGIAEGAELVGLGLTDALITRLSRLEAVSIRPASAVLRLAEAAEDPLETGRQLRVDGVLEGTVQSTGERQRVSVRLLAVGTESTVWAETFDAAVEDPFALQDEISERVAEALRLELTGSDRSRLRRRSTENREAWETYVRGRFFWNKRTAAGLESAIRSFESAVALDPAFALAYAGLADSYAVLPLFGGVAPTEAFPQAIAAANRALALDPNLAEAHTSLAYARCFYEWSWSAAEAGFRRAIELNPSYANAHHWYAFLLSALDRRDEALATIRRARELDPLSQVITTDHGFVLYLARRPDEAIDQVKEALELDPAFPYGLFVLSLALVAAGRPGEAVERARRAVELTDGDNSAMQAALGLVLATAGEVDEARRLAAELEKRIVDEPAQSSRAALIYTALGDVRTALERLRAAVAERSRFVVLLGVWPVFDPLRDEPGFRELIRLVGLDRASGPRSP